MKEIRATKRMLGKYLHGHGKALCCSRCGRRIVEEEPVMVTARSVNHYCLNCADKIEI